MTCPNCGGPVWDNAEKVAKGWKGPLMKCRDDQCGWIVWPPKPKPAPTRPLSGPTQPVPRTARWTWPELSATYYQSLLIARKQVIGLATAAKIDYTMADILAAAATVFIAASRDGVKQPQPEPEPEEVEA
jgi:hypothetical protein